MRGFGWRTACLVALALSLGGAAACAADSVPSAPRVAGAHAGLWSWDLPDTPNGTVPKQSWSGPGAASAGEIFVGGMDHVANAALYRLPATDADASQPGSTLWYAGDAKAASLAVGNYRTGEPIEKFHTQPTAMNGKVYVANLNNSVLDASYLGIRGFHWYGYDKTTAKLGDLTVGQPGGVAIAHGGLVGMVADAAQNQLFGAVAPTGQIVRFNAATRATTVLGRPASYNRPYVYPGRTLWMSSRGRVYFTAGNPGTAPSAKGPYTAAIFNHVHYWDPKTKAFGQEQGWLLHDTRALDFGRCYAYAGLPRTCFLMDNVGHVYRYRETATNATWTYLGGIGQENDKTFGMTWVFQIRPDWPEQPKAYIISRRGFMFEFDLATGRATQLGNLWTLEPSLAGRELYGNTSWDNHGRFYFAAFPKLPTDPGRAKLVALDPAAYLPAIR